ncbi:MAG TPA: hypothetical protein P5567_06910 [Kiritimatiellia bacterium]|nr:hypothetical protein [Kiritimatiellia bacterium]HRZ12168.1 hypothetical protein [Kiritimatiellia bacterium]HSA18074.1 hypothetical protein [Kiritimatiellia bacterium]
MKRPSRIGLAAGALLLRAALSHGQMLAEVSSRTADGWQVGAGFENFTANYTIDTVYKNLTTPDFSWDLFSLHGALALGPRLDVFLVAALIDEARNSDHPDISGEGGTFGAGLRGLLWEKNGFDLSAYGQLSYATEDFSDERLWDEHIGSHTNERSLEFTELILGLVASYTRGGFTLYAGPETLAYEDGNYHYTTLLEDGSVFAEETLDIEQTDKTSLRIGARYRFESLWLAVSAALVHEEAELFSAGWVF